MDLTTALSGIKLNEERFLNLLEKLIGETEGLQNSPSQGITSASIFFIFLNVIVLAVFLSLNATGLVPQEDNASRHVLDILTPHSVENGGILHIEVLMLPLYYPPMET